MAASAEGEQNKVEADISPFRQNEVELAFNLSYIDAENVIGDFKHELHAKHRYWTEHRTKYVPYWTLFQASGYGKSRLIKEVAKDIPTLYLCLHPAASTGYPPRTEIIANFLEKTFFVQLRQGEEWRLAYILFQLMNLFYTKNKIHSPEQMWDLQMGLWGPTFWTEVLKNIENWKQVTENEVLEIMSQNLPWQSLSLYASMRLGLFFLLGKMPLTHSDSFEELYDKSAGRANGQDSLYCFWIHLVK